MTKNKYLPIIGAILFASLFNNLEVLAYRFIPMNFWLEYQDIIPANPYYIGEELKMKSIVTVNRKVSISWIDKLKCECTDGDCDSDGFDTFSVYLSGSENYQPKQDTVNWNYQGAKPLYETTCYIDSDITLNTPGGKKTQNLKGSLFDVRVRDNQKENVIEIEESIEDIKEKNE